MMALGNQHQRKRSTYAMRGLEEIAEYYRGRRRFTYETRTAPTYPHPLGLRILEDGRCVALLAYVTRNQRRVGAQP